MNKFIFVASVLFFIFFIVPQKSYAQQCINGGVECCLPLFPGGPCGGDTFPGSCNSSCSPVCGGGARVEGGNCYVQGSTPPPGGGGGGSCSPTATKVDCPTGTVRGTTVVASQCGGNTCVGLGSAQVSGDCCNWVTDPRECSDWYYCPTPNNPTKMCRDCTNPQPYCNRWTLNTYDCVSVCNTTAPTGPSFSNGAITWTVGSNGTSQNLYVSTTSTDVTNNCGSGTSCTTNLSLATNITGHTFSPTLTPSTTYYVKIVTYKDSSCSSSTLYNFITPAPNNPWWQVGDGDITTTTSIFSNVPSGSLFNTIGLGGFPGVPVYGTTFNLYPTYPTRVSTTVWNANTTTRQTRLFNYEFFEKLITDDIVFNDISILPSGTGATLDANGYEWYMANGNLNTSGNIDLGSRKVILFVDSGNLTVGGRINLTDNQGFFGAFVNGSITIDPAVTGTPSIEGVYLSDGTFSSSVGTAQLHVRGSVASFGGISLGRDLTNNTNPAELFEFAPDQLVLFPEKLMNKRAKWSEVAP